MYGYHGSASECLGRPLCPGITVATLAETSRGQRTLYVGSCPQCHCISYAWLRRAVLLCRQPEPTAGRIPRCHRPCLALSRSVSRTASWPRSPFPRSCAPSSIVQHLQRSGDVPDKVGSPDSFAWGRQPVPWPPRSPAMGAPLLAVLPRRISLCKASTALPEEASAEGRPHVVLRTALCCAPLCRTAATYAPSRAVLHRRVRRRFPPPGRISCRRLAGYWYMRRGGDGKEHCMSYYRAGRDHCAFKLRGMLESGSGLQGPRRCAPLSPRL